MIIKSRWSGFEIPCGAFCRCVGRSSASRSSWSISGTRTTTLTSWWVVFSRNSRFFHHFPSLGLPCCLRQSCSSREGVGGKNLPNLGVWGVCWSVRSWNPAFNQEKSPLNSCSALGSDLGPSWAGFPTPALQLWGVCCTLYQCWALCKRPFSAKNQLLKHQWGDSCGIWAPQECFQDRITALRASRLKMRWCEGDRLANFKN